MSGRGRLHDGRPRPARSVNVCRDVRDSCAGTVDVRGPSRSERLTGCGGAGYWSGRLMNSSRARPLKARRRPPRPRHAKRVTVACRSSGAVSTAARTPVDRLRAICLALPETTEKLAWGEPTWRVKGRLFAQLDDHHHGADHLAVWLPAPLGEQEAMIFSDPARFFRPPYVGHRGWVGVRIDGRPDWTLVATLVEQAYQQVAPPSRRTPRVSRPEPRVPTRRSR
jgi:predicted DNA-binding protein (MmcQ/YjbR family)